MQRILLATVAVLFSYVSIAQNGGGPLKKDVPLDSVRLSDPFILADKKTSTYYMTGTGGKLWKSKDLRKWTGPYTVVQTDPKSWMGPNPMIWAAEIHERNGKYYYFATFTNKAVEVSKGLERRACHVLVSDQPDGPYLPYGDDTFLPADKLTLDATIWKDVDQKTYMLYCHEWLQNNNGTIEMVEMKPDWTGTLGKPEILFLASDSPWSRENTKDGSVQPNKVTDGPWVFKTKTGKLGMVWTSWIRDVYTQGVAYSKSGTLHGPWVQEKDPITSANIGHSMLFRTFDGKLLMSVHSHKGNEGKTIRIPQLFEVDDSGDKIVVGEKF